MMPNVPCSPLKLLKVRRITGYIAVPDEKESMFEEWNGRRSSLVLGNIPLTKNDICAGQQDALVKPPRLLRSQSMTGHIIVFEPHEEPPQAFWLQRKIGVKVGGGIVRLGCRLQKKSKPQIEESSSDTWELAVDELGNPFFVKVAMMSTDILTGRETGQNAINELMALQLIAEHSNGIENHVIGTNMLGSCETHVYAVLPHYADGSLMQYTLSHGKLEESVARLFFRQILQGLKTLHDMGLCHRNLSLDAVELNGKYAAIGQLDWCTRFTPSSEQDILSTPAGISPLFIAPEYFRGSSNSWDGFTADLWAAGLMLYTMVVGSEALFAAPIKEDKLFVALCIDGKIRQTVNANVEASEPGTALSDDLIELLERILKADPKQRYSLDEAISHRWVQLDDLKSPEF